MIIVASVSCIYNLGDPEDYKNLGLHLFEGKKIKPAELVRGLLRLQYAQDIELKRGTFRKASTDIEIVAPSGQEVTKIKFGRRGKLLGDDIIEKISVAQVADPEELELKDLKYEKFVDKMKR